MLAQWLGEMTRKWLSYFDEKERHEIQSRDIRIRLLHEYSTDIRDLLIVKMARILDLYEEIEDTKDGLTL